MRSYNKEDGWVRVTLDADHKGSSIESGRFRESGSLRNLRNAFFERFYRVDKARSRETWRYRTWTRDHEKRGPDASRRDPCGQCRGRGKYLYGADPVDLYSVGGEQMKKLLKIRAFFLLFALLFVFERLYRGKSCGAERKCLYDYYLNTSGIQLVGSEYRTETADTDALVRELLDRMGKCAGGPRLSEGAAGADRKDHLPDRGKCAAPICGCQLRADEFGAGDPLPGGSHKDTDPDSGYRVSEHLLRGAADHGRSGKSGRDVVGVRFSWTVSVMSIPLNGRS